MQIRSSRACAPTPSSQRFAPQRSHARTTSGTRTNQVLRRAVAGLQPAHHESRESSRAESRAASGAGTAAGSDRIALAKCSFRSGGRSDNCENSEDRSLTCCLNTVQKVDVAQRVDELLFLYTNIRLRHQRNKTTVGRTVPSHLLTDYNGGPLGDCSKLLRFRDIRCPHSVRASARPNGDMPASTQNT